MSWEVLDGVGAAVEVEVVEGRREGEGDTLGLPEAVLVLLRLDPLEGVRCAFVRQFTVGREGAGVRENCGVLRTQWTASSMVTAPLKIAPQP